jgi:hypothetical protein
MPADLGALHFDVDFLRLFSHNDCTSLVKGCAFLNTTLPLFSEQSREVFYFLGCGFRLSILQQRPGKKFFHILRPLQIRGGMVLIYPILNRRV